MSTKIKKTKGQVGETLTWIVATLLIIVLLLFFIFGASLLGKTKKVGNFRSSLTSKSSFEGGDIFLKKSLFTYVSLGPQSKRIVVDKKLIQFSGEGKFNIDYNKTKKEILSRYKKR